MNRITSQLGPAVRPALVVAALLGAASANPELNSPRYGQRRTSAFMQQMWDKYRHNLPPALGAQ